MNTMVRNGMGQARKPSHTAFTRASKNAASKSAQNHAPSSSKRICSAEATSDTSYLKLDFASQQIRLLELRPTTAASGIASSFRCVELSECPSYTALSYAWGDEGALRRIQLDGGGNIQVRNNLWCFLRIQSSVFTEPKLFWIDAICINQANIHERNHQVNLMKQIYENADDVYVWLGSEADNSDSAMDFIATKGTRELRRKGSGYHAIWTKQVGEAVYELCERTYWRRMWIIQEIVHARKITVWCGTQCLLWHMFEGLYRTLRTLETSPWFAHQEYAIKVLQSSACVMVWQRAQLRHSDTPASQLQTLVKVSRNWQCTDVWDKVYALASIASPESAIVPDYSKSGLEAYRAVQEKHDGDKEQFYGMLGQVLAISAVELYSEAVEALQMRAAPGLGDPYSSWSPSEMKTKDPFNASTPTTNLSFASDYDNELLLPESPEEDFMFPAFEQENLDVYTVSPVENENSEEASDDTSRPGTPEPGQYVKDDTAVSSRLSHQVDYLSHEWREEDIWSSWRCIVTRRGQFPNSARLENASWRAWIKAKNYLKTVSPEVLNWLKDCDVTWLYGRL